MSRLEEMLPEATSIDGIDSLAIAEERGFYLYREAAILVTIVASSYRGCGDEEFPLDRDQAILSGLLMRIAKFMRVITGLAAEHESGDVILALNRCVFETSINLEYLATSKSSALVDSFIESSLAPERELYDRIQSNVAARGGDILPIELRMISSIQRTCRASGKTIDQIDARRAQWGVNLRERMNQLNKGDLYLYMQRIASHAIHGTWVDLKLHHLREDESSGRYQVNPKKRPDARLLTPSAVLVLTSVLAYVEIAFADVADLDLMRSRLVDLMNRIVAFERIHEVLFQQD